MQRHTGERGAALILLIGITAALATLTAALVLLLVNQQGATAGERTAKTSLFYTEAALDSGINAIKATTVAGTNFSTTTAIDMSQMSTQYDAAYPSPAPEPTCTVYDNSINDTTAVDKNVHYDANGDHKLWVEAQVTYLGRTSRLREMLTSDTKTSILPKAALFADTDIVANGTSDIYAVQPLTGAPYTTSPREYLTSIMAGSDFTGNNSTNLAAPSQTAQSLGINVNGTVSLPGITENGVTIGGVGLLSDYFDQAHQAVLSDLSQLGIAAPHPDVAIPTAPIAPTPPMTSGQRTTIQGTGPQTYTAPTDFYYGGSLTLRAASGSSTFTFRRLYLTGTLTVTGNVTVNATDLRVGSLVVSGATTAKTLSLGPVYVTGNVTVSGASAFKTTSMYTGGSFAITGPTTSITHTLGPLYTTGAFSVSSRAVVNATDVHAGSTFTITGPTTSPAITDSLGSLYAVGTVAITGNAQVTTTALYTGGNFTISGTTTDITEQLGDLFVVANVDWRGGSSGLLTVNAGNVYAKRFLADGDTNGNYVSGSGAYRLNLGYTWIDGDAGTGAVAINFSAPAGTRCTVMCPLIATTEKTVSNGLVDCGTLTDPMVYYMQCDNDGAYTNTFTWASTGQFTGLIVILEAAIVVSGGNDGTHPNILGSLMAGAPIPTDLTLSGNTSVCYDQRVIENLPAALQTILRTSTTTTVPGTWQQLSAN